MNVNGKSIHFSGSESELLNEIRKKLKPGQHLVVFDEVVMIGHINKRNKFVLDDLPQNFFYSLEKVNMRLPQLLLVGHQPLKQWRGFRNEDSEKVAEFRNEAGWKRMKAMSLKATISNKLPELIHYNHKDYDMYRLPEEEGGGIVLTHPGQLTPLVYYPETLGKDPYLMYSF